MEGNGEKAGTEIFFRKDVFFLKKIKGEKQVVEMRRH